MGSYMILLRQIRSCVSAFESRLLPLIGIHRSENDALFDALNWNYNPPATNMPCDSSKDPASNNETLLGRIIGDGFMWAVQTHRRSLEARLKRKNAVEKHLKRKRNLLMCNICGHFHEAHTICGNCYEKVREETKAIQNAMSAEWKMEPVDKEVVVLYNNDDKNNKEFWKGKRIVEINRERPLWFHKNLQSKCNTIETPTKSDAPQSPTILSHVK